MLELKRWTPFMEEGMWSFEGLANLHHEMDRVFGNLRGEMPFWNRHDFAPAVEVTSDENAWHVKMALPGMEPKDVNVEVTENMLTVTGERKMEEKKEGENRRTEFGYGRFERSFTLPRTVNVEKVAATFENGMLELHLPLMETAKPRKIAVKKGAKLLGKKAA